MLLSTLFCAINHNIGHIVSLLWQAQILRIIQSIRLLYQLQIVQIFWWNSHVLRFLGERWDLQLTIFFFFLSFMRHFAAFLNLQKLIGFVMNFLVLIMKWFEELGHIWSTFIQHFNIYYLSLVQLISFISFSTRWYNLPLIVIAWNCFFRHWFFICNFIWISWCFLGCIKCLILIALLSFIWLVKAEVAASLGRTSFWPLRCNCVGISGFCRRFVINCLLGSIRLPLRIQIAFVCCRHGLVLPRRLLPLRHAARCIICLTYYLRFAHVLIQSRITLRLFQITVWPLSIKSANSRITSWQQKILLRTCKCRLVTVLHYQLLALVHLCGQTFVFLDKVFCCAFFIACVGWSGTVSESWGVARLSWSLIIGSFLFVHVHYLTLVQIVILK